MTRLAAPAGRHLPFDSGAHAASTAIAISATVTNVRRDMGWDLLGMRAPREAALLQAALGLGVEQVQRLEVEDQRHLGPERRRAVGFRLRHQDVLADTAVAVNEAMIAMEAARDVAEAAARPR